MTDTERLEIYIENKWLCGEDASRCFRKYIVTNPWAGWPECVVADGDTPREAIDSAIELLKRRVS